MQNTEEELIERVQGERTAAEAAQRASLSRQERARAEHDSRMADIRREYQQGVADAQAVLEARSHVAQQARARARNARAAVLAGRRDNVRISRVHAGIDSLAGQAAAELEQTLLEKSRTFANGPSTVEAAPLAALFLMARPELGFIDYLHSLVSDVPAPAHGLTAETDEEFEARIAALEAEAQRLDDIAGAAEAEAREAAAQVTVAQNRRIV